MTKYRTKEELKRITKGNVFDQTAVWIISQLESGRVPELRLHWVERALKGLDRLSQRYGDDCHVIWLPESFNQADRSALLAAYRVASGFYGQEQQLSPLILGYLQGAGVHLRGRRKHD